MATCFYIRVFGPVLLGLLKKRHAQNNNKGAVLFKAMLMIGDRQRDGYRAVHNAIEHDCTMQLKR